MKQKKKLKQVKIYMKRWARCVPEKFEAAKKQTSPAVWLGFQEKCSSKYGQKLLHEKDGMMCCLGFLCNQAHRVKRDKLRGVNDPECLAREWTDEQKKFFGDAISINDSPYNHDIKTTKGQQNKLKQLFKRNGYEAIFVE